VTTPIRGPSHELANAPPVPDEFEEALVLPDALKRVIADLLEGWDGRTPIRAGRLFTELVAWYNVHYEAMRVGEWDEHTLEARDPASVSVEFADETMFEVLAELFPNAVNADGELEITDAMRMAAVREVLAQGRTEWDTFTKPCGVLQLPFTSLPAFLGYGVAGSSYEGLIVERIGIFPSPAAVWSFLREHGWFFNRADLDAAPDSKLLALWDADQVSGATSRPRAFGVSFVRTESRPTVGF
jgi:hypothetical protein